MGWALVPTTWFTNEYKRHLNDTYTYTFIDDFNLERHITDSNKLLYKLKSRFNDLITPDKRKLLNSADINDIHIPYMKLLPKVHKLTSIASARNLDLLTGRPIITAHSWTTSNVSKLLGTELDNIIKQLKDLFHSKNIHFPLIYNSSELIDLLQQQHVTDIKIQTYLISPTFIVTFYLILTTLLTTEISFLLDKTSINRRKAWLWVVIIAVKSPTLYFLLANFIILLTTGQLNILFFHVTLTTVFCLLLIIQIR